MNKPRNLPTTRPIYLFVTILYTSKYIRPLQTCTAYAPHIFWFRTYKHPPPPRLSVPTPHLELVHRTPCLLVCAVGTARASLRICHASPLDQLSFLPACPEQLETRPIQICAHWSGLTIWNLDTLVPWFRQYDIHTFLVDSDLYDLL